MTYPYYRLTDWEDKGGGKNKEKHILGWFEHFKELGRPVAFVRSFKGCAIWVTGMECRYVPNIEPFSGEIVKEANGFTEVLQKEV